MSGGRGLLTLLSDFGTRDGYVGAMKGAALAIDPTLRLVDLAHDVPAQQVRAGAHALAAAAPWFPDGTTHLAVVDPGVGTPRAPIAVAAGGHLLVAPDNGLLELAGEALGGITEARVIGDHAYRAAAGVTSTTFHGRDVFAPTAAALASGRLSLDQVGPALDPATLVQLPETAPDEVQLVDHFGNCVTGLDRAALAAAGARAVRLPGGRLVPIVQTYGDVARGAPLALVGSTGRLEVAVRDGSAAAELGLALGARVALSALDDGGGLEG